MEMKNLLLVGNPNTGKTTFFNTITKSDEHVGNWHGVTVDGKSKKYVLETISSVSRTEFLGILEDGWKK